MGAFILSLIAAVAQGATYREGRTLWQERCVQCHSSQPSAPQNAAFYAGVQWARFFDREKHKKPPLKQMLSEEERQEVLSYLKAHAADSDHPEVAGIN